MPSLAYEQELWRQGYQQVAGIDEAGRGCWAGPVVAAAVIFPPEIQTEPQLLHGIDDSKRLSPQRRRELVPLIMRAAAGVAVGAAPAFLIDSLGIMRATRLAMEMAALGLPYMPDALIIDAVRLPALPMAQTALIGADGLSYSVAAASIVAKTVRDDWMSQIERDGRYGFAVHKGYGTAGHLAALRRWGPSRVHRRSFRPLWNEEYR